MINQLLNNRYLILKRLGRGGFSEIFLAEDQRPIYPSDRPRQQGRHPRQATGISKGRSPQIPRDSPLPEEQKRLCVVKWVQNSASSPNGQTAERLFETEVQTLHRVGRLNPFIPSLIDHFVEDGKFYLVQEYIEGNSLMSEIAQGKSFTEAEILSMLRHLLSIVRFIHARNVIHCDIKPRNLIRRRSDGRLVLIDFGAVRFATDVSVSSASNSSSNLSMVSVSSSSPFRSREEGGGATGVLVVGTAGYMPNEQQAGRSRFNTDIYALGMVMIHCLTGVHPKHLHEDPATGEILWQQCVTLSPPLMDILSKMVKVRVRERYQSAMEVLRDLDRWQRSYLNRPSWLPTGSSVNSWIDSWKYQASRFRIRPKPFLRPKISYSLRRSLFKNWQRALNWLEGRSRQFKFRLTSFKPVVLLGFVLLSLIGIVWFGWGNLQPQQALQPLTSPTSSESIRDSTPWLSVLQWAGIAIPIGTALFLRRLKLW
jgi:serine/threonine protein kinase